MGWQYAKQISTLISHHIEQEEEEGELVVAHTPNCESWNYTRNRSDLGFGKDYFDMMQKAWMIKENGASSKRHTYLSKDT